jgi:hypothetical protein
MNTIRKLSMARSSTKSLKFMKKKYKSKLEKKKVTMQLNSTITILEVWS